MSDTRDFGYPERDDQTIPGDLVSEDEYCHIVGHLGDERDQARENIYRVDTLVREAYDACREGVAAKLPPAVVVQFDDSGGTYTLIQEDGQRETVHVRPEPYQAVKSLCHVPLGIYSILAPYLNTPQVDGWREALEEFAASIHDVLGTISDVGLEAEVEAASRTVCSEAVGYINSCLKEGAFDLDGFRSFSAAVLPSINVLMPVAGKAQASMVIELLERWRDRLGSEWRNLTGIVLAPYTLSVDNAAAQCLRYVMDPEVVHDRLVVLQGDFKNEVDPAIEIVAHLYMDRLVSRLVFGEDTDENRELTRSLSSERDLVAGVAAVGVDAVAAHQACPKVKMGSSA